MRLGKILRWIGIGLIVCCVLLIGIYHVRSGIAQKQMNLALTHIQSVLPERITGIMDTYSSMNMPALQVNGLDYVALLEVPRLGIALPIRSGWSVWQSIAYPSRFSGSVYDGTLVIGGTDGKGQLDFFEKLENGDTIYVTDMSGICFHYIITKITRSEKADVSTLQDENCQLTLFTWDQFSLDYIILRCNGS